MHRNAQAPGSRDAGPDHAVVDGPSEGAVAARGILVLAGGDHLGDLTAKDTVEVHGRVLGTVRGGVVRIQPGARVEGEVHAGHLYVDGEVAGLCHAVRVQAGPGAAVAGVVVADSVASSGAAISAVACVAPGNYLDRDLVARARALIADEGVAHDPLAMRGLPQPPADLPAPAWPVAGGPSDEPADALAGAAHPGPDGAAGMFDDGPDGHEWPRHRGRHGAHGGGEDGEDGVPPGHAPGVGVAAAGPAGDAAPADEPPGPPPPAAPVRHHARVRDLPPSPDAVDLADPRVDAPAAASVPVPAAPADGAFAEGAPRPGPVEAPEPETLPSPQASDAPGSPGDPAPDGPAKRTPAPKAGFRAKRRPSVADGAALPAAAPPATVAAERGPAHGQPPEAPPSPAETSFPEAGPSRPPKPLDPARAIDALDDYFAPSRREDPRIGALADAMRASAAGDGPVAAVGAAGRTAGARPAEFREADRDPGAAPAAPATRAGGDPPRPAGAPGAATPRVMPFLIAPRDR